MTDLRLIRTAALAGACLAVLELAACATAPQAGPAPRPVSRVAPPAPEPVSMAPIPNPERAPAAVREAAADARPKTSRKRVEPTRATVTIVKPSPAPAASAAAKNPVRAAQLRARGLEELNRGKVARTVQLLAEASRLDPQNMLIRRDLERAQRIERAVSAQD